MKKLFLFGLLIIFGGLVGCKQPTDSEPTYTVWTDSGTYEEFQITLEDGYYAKAEIINTDFNQMSLPNEDKHYWTENQIYDWFIGRGFDAVTANREKSWLITVNHGLIASRRGDIVYLIIK